MALLWQMNIIWTERNSTGQKQDDIEKHTQKENNSATRGQTLQNNVGKGHR